jgi:hypothetical protein
MPKLGLRATIILNLSLITLVTVILIGVGVFNTTEKVMIVTYT